MPGTQRAQLVYGLPLAEIFYDFCDELKSAMRGHVLAAARGVLLSCPPSAFALERFSSSPGEIVNYSVTASDEVDPAPDVVCVPPSGSSFPLGTTLVTCTATDASGNQSTCEFPVTVALKARRR